MGGHSHWSTIKRQKGASDAKRGQLFTKLSQEVTVAAREGGGDANMNPRLRLAIDKARENNMPADTIKRAVERGAGGADAAALVETAFEGYGPGGVAIIVQVVTDNRNRTVSSVRTTLARGGGSLSESGSVAWQFDSVGYLALQVGDGDPEEIALAAIDAGAQDVRTEDDRVEVYTAPTELFKVRRALEEADLSVTTAELSMLPKNVVTLDEKSASQVLRLLDTLEDLDDVQKVFSNADFPDSVLMEYAAAR
ncbi:MAG: YebC/PmpR family DNA-binding transcriptional regulator [Dehalococcoidia bacterium]|nr:MAG: YebC/PmpR family DNA-binding transcriptional regulator [Dehalococcoidia bacterium]